MKLVEPTMPLVGFGTQAVDLDNNGILELVVANGHVDSYPAELNPAPYAQPMLVFRRQAHDQYQANGDQIEGGYLSQRHVGRALWTVDANRDGQVDLLVTHQTEPVSLLINQTEHAGRWIELSLVGTECSRDAIGSVITIKSGKESWVLSLMSGDGYLCSNQRIAHCGLGKDVSRCVVTVKWPHGSEQDYAELSADQRWMLIQGERQAFQLP